MYNAKSDPKLTPSKKRALLPSITNKETRFQEDRMQKVSSLEEKLRKKRALRDAHKTVVQELYSSKEPKEPKEPKDPKEPKETKEQKEVKVKTKVKSDNKACLPDIVIAPTVETKDTGPGKDDDDVYSENEDEANFLRYTGRRQPAELSLDINVVGVTLQSGDKYVESEGRVPSNTPRRCSSARERRPSAAQAEVDMIYEKWELSRKYSKDDMSLSVCSFLKRPDQDGQTRRKSNDSGQSCLDLLSRSADAINSLAESLEPGERRSSNGQRRPSLYQMTKSETDIWRHCQRVQRRKSRSVNDVSMEELLGCRYLRIPARYMENQES